MSKDCPSQTDLESLFLAELDEEASVRVAEHIAACAECSAKMDVLIEKEMALAPRQDDDEE